MKGIREIALTPYYPYGKNKEKIIEERTEQVDKAISEHDLEIRADERRKVLAPYDVESIEELIQNVRAKAIEELLKDLCVGCGYLKGTECVNRHCLCDISQSYVVERANNLLEMKGDKE